MSALVITDTTSMVVDTAMETDWVSVADIEGTRASTTKERNQGDFEIFILMNSLCASSSAKLLY